MIAELDVTGGRIVAGRLLKDETHATIALFIGQDLVSVGLVDSRDNFIAAMKNDRVSLDLDAVHVRFVTDRVIGLVFIGTLVPVLGFVGHHLVERSVLQQRVDRLPVAAPIRKRAVFDLVVVEIAFVDIAVVIVGMRVIMGVSVGVLGRLFGLRLHRCEQKSGRSGDGEVTGNGLLHRGAFLRS